jgi:hypothetical protein
LTFFSILLSLGQHSNAQKRLRHDHLRPRSDATLFHTPTTNAKNSKSRTTTTKVSQTSKESITNQTVLGFRASRVVSTSSTAAVAGFTKVVVETSGRVCEDLRVAVKFCGKRHAACAWATWMMEEIIFELAGRLVGRELLLGMKETGRSMRRVLSFVAKNKLEH